MQGTKVIEAAADWAEALRAKSPRVVIDLGSGDGRWVYESARKDPGSTYVGLDPDSDGLSDYAYRASRKPARGGVANAHFVVASVERLPPELAGIADLVRVNFPWGSLLRGLLAPDETTLLALRGLAVEGGRFEVIMSYDPEHDTGAFTGVSLAALDEAYIKDVLVPAYEAAGLPVGEHRRLTQDEALEVPSSWGRRLLHARPRSVYYLSGVMRR